MYPLCNIGVLERPEFVLTVTTLAADCVIGPEPTCEFSVAYGVGLTPQTFTFSLQVDCCFISSSTTFSKAAALFLQYSSLLLSE